MKTVKIKIKTVKKYDKQSGYERKIEKLYMNNHLMNKFEHGNTDDWLTCNQCMYVLEATFDLLDINYEVKDERENPRWVNPKW